MEKVCRHCGATVLVGLEYCPGCLRAIEPKKGSASAASTPDSELALRGAPAISIRSAPPDLPPGFRRDIKDNWLIFSYNWKATRCAWFKKPEPPIPPLVQRAFVRRETPVQDYREPKAPANMALTLSYTRVVCPNCQRVQRGDVNLSPHDLVTCHACQHQFPGSFAAEFRKGADLQCYQCGVTTFCVSGLQHIVCPNCKSRAARADRESVPKPQAYVTLAALAFIGFLLHAIATHTAPQFFVGVCVVCIGSMVGFVTMVALGY